MVAATDADTHVALYALDLLSRCASSPEAVALLGHEVDDLSHAGSPRGWHRAAHALVALATAAPERGTAALAQFKGSRIWQLRMYAARAAAVLKDRDTLAALASDDDDNVREAAVEGLRKVAGHAADAVYIAQLTRPGYQVLRAAALALEGTASADAAAPALKAAWQRLVGEGHDNSHDARDAIAKTLAALGADPREARRPASDGARPSDTAQRSECRRTCGVSRRRAPASRSAASARSSSRCSRRRRRRRSSASRASRSRATTTA